MKQQQILEEFAAGSINWGPLVLMGNMMPPRDPDEDDEDEEDEEDEEEPPIVREPDED
ncbi:hypothetical protein [Bradyrhizobium sp. WSM3983]|uniref:hypothetical protein n=1 Tax=Bradyrhizobium sp. WSM3983 TaxID=1038867 RepID=UPI00042251A5|nr:hypothetical protein [Bradyrhizobium sp. WSM3983]